MREASERRTVTDTDSYAFSCINHLNANERMTEAKSNLMKKVIFFIAILLLMPCHECELYAQKKKVTASNRTTKTTKSKETIEFEKLLLKAKKGDPEAQTSVGLYYAYGCGVTKDLDIAMAWFQKAIDSGYGHACSTVALIWEQENNYEKRLDYLRIGVTLNDADCYSYLHSDYHEGKHGVEKNENLALELVKKGSDLKLPTMFWNRYFAHRYGKPGFAESKEDAIFWLKRAIDYYYDLYRSQKDGVAKQMYNENYKYWIKVLKEELGCDYDPALHVDEYKAWLADKPAPRASKQQSSTTYSSSPANTTAPAAPTTYHYTKSGRGQSQNTGQWTDGMASQYCAVQFFDDYITVNGEINYFVGNSGSWKIYRGTSMNYGGCYSKSYYYVDANKNMKEVCESGSPYGLDTFVYPMSMNGDPTPHNDSYNNSYNNSQSNYHNSSSSSSSGSQSSSTQPSRKYKCAYCNNGMIEKNDPAPPSFGIDQPKKKCPTCGKWYDPTVSVHYHQQCHHCGGTGYAK